MGHLFLDHIGTVCDVFHVDFLLQLWQILGSRCAFMSVSIRKYAICSGLSGSAVSSGLPPIKAPAVDTVRPLWMMRQWLYPGDFNAQWYDALAAEHEKLSQQIQAIEAQKR